MYYIVVEREIVKKQKEKEVFEMNEDKDASKTILNGKDYSCIEIIDQEHGDKLIAKIAYDKATVKNGYTIRFTK